MRRELAITGLLVLATALAGCAGSGGEQSPVPRELNIVVENEGDTAMGTDLTVEAPNGDGLLSRSFDAEPGTTEFSVTMDVDDRHEVHAHYRESTAEQTVDGDRRHLIAPSDCEEGPITVRFLIEYTRSDSGNSWNNKGSVGECPSPAEDG